ncbi:dynactin subunit 1-like isoform X2 [Watersipora subatra]|uniref:dynactin subunit 1-like isoform X2 n=1 Tax=Watersipora subatra TaxID=2589382 RepID=UPI00355BC41A
MSSPSLQSSLTQYEQLVKKQLSFTEDDDTEAVNSHADREEGVFDKPLTEERQQGMRAVQSTLERLDSKHGVLERPASAECVRYASDENDFLKRTMSDSIRRSANKVSDSGSDLEELTPASTDTSSEPRRSRQSSLKSDTEERRNGLPSRIPQADPVKPQVKTPLTTKRTVPVSPYKAKTQEPLKVRNQDQDVSQDSPEKAPSLRQLLIESKAETSDLRHQLELLAAENHRLKTEQGLPSGRTTPSETSHVHSKLADTERRCDTLLKEKENMATELWKLRQQVEDLLTSKSEFGSEPGDGTGSQSAASAIKERRIGGNVSNLEQQIDDMQSQILDLQEASETSSAEVLRLDQENQMLTAHIKRLTADREEDTEAERELLQQQIHEMKKQQERQTEDEMLHLKSEMARLRIDLKATQEKADILQEENVKLRDSLREAKSVSRMRGSSNNMTESLGERQENRRSKDVAWEEISSLKQKIREFSSRNPAGSPSSIRTLEKKTSPLSAVLTSPTNYDRIGNRPVYGSKDSPLGKSAYSPPSRRNDNYRPSYQPSNHSSDDRPPSPSGRSDISDSTTALMAGYETYRPLSRSGIARFTPTYRCFSSATISRLSASRKLEDDRTSECTMDILNEATFNSQAFGAYDVNDVTTERVDVRRESIGPSNHIRRGSVGSSSMQSESTQERLAIPPSFGLRSVLVPVLPTQHNIKQEIVVNRSGLSTVGRRPFAPRSPADLTIGDIAKFTKPDGRICRGTVKFIGHLHDKNETYIGLELEHQEGRHDGLYEGVRYFDCKPNRGAFITFNKVIMVWGS